MINNNNKNSKPYESEMTYSQANGINKTLGDSAFLIPVEKADGEIEYLYPQELIPATVKAFNSPDEERKFKRDQYLKELSRRKAENPLADYLAGLVLGVPTAGILQGLMPAAQYASGIKTAGKSVGKNAWEGIKHVGRVAKNPANAKTTIGTIGATLGDIYGTVSAIKGGAEILDKWSSGKFDHQDIPEFVLNLTGTIPAAYATKQSIDYASDLANSIYKYSKATKKLPHFEDPVITKANSAEQINSVSPFAEVTDSPRLRATRSSNISYEEGLGLPKHDRYYFAQNLGKSKISESEKLGTPKGERNNGKYKNLNFIRTIGVVPRIDHEGFVQVAPLKNTFTNTSVDNVIATHPNYSALKNHLMIINSEGMRGAVPFSIEPSDFFFDSRTLKVKPKHITFISGDEEALEQAKKLGYNILTTPILKHNFKYFNPQSESFDMQDQLKYRKIYEDEIRRISRTYFNRPSFDTYEKISTVTGIPNPVLKFTGKNFIYPMESSDINWHKNMFKNIVYDPASPIESRLAPSIIGSSGFLYDYDTKYDFGTDRYFIDDTFHNSLLQDQIDKYINKHNIKPLRYGGKIKMLSD